MTGTNVTSLISNTVAILKATTKDYNIVSDGKGLRGAFHEAGRALPLVEKALHPAKTQVDGRDLARDPRNAMGSLEACNTKAKLSESKFKVLGQALETSGCERYKATVRQEGTEHGGDLGEGNND
ncbi:hypothetical protein FALCPG4_015613 [Fusarium falciforme]